MVRSGPSWCELQGLQCRPDGSFIPLQCDVTSCWCVSEDGQEVGGTRTLRQTGRTPSCDRKFVCLLFVVVSLKLGLHFAHFLSPGPLCPDPAVTHGALVCRPAANGRQSCDLVCHRGYQNSLPVSSFLCESDSRRWEGDNTPLPGACQSKTSDLRPLKFHPTNFNHINLFQVSVYFYVSVHSHQC